MGWGGGRRLWSLALRTSCLLTGRISRFLPSPRAQAKEGVSLLTGRNSTEGEALPDELSASNETVVASYLKPNVTIQVVNDFR